MNCIYSSVLEVNLLNKPWDRMHTDATEADGVRGEQHKVIAMLHAGDDPVSAQVLIHRLSQGFVVRLGQLHSSAVVLANHLQ